MEKHGITIAANNVKTFTDVDEILSLFKHDFIKNFNVCNTNSFSFGILRLIAKNYYKEQGIIIPNDGILETIKLEPEEGKNTVVAIRFKKGGLELIIHFEYEANIKITKFVTESVINVEELLIKYEQQKK